MSCFMGDWDKYELLKLRVSNTNPAIAMKTYLYKDDTLFFSKVCTKWEAGYFPNRLTVPVSISK
ncbi:MAG: hypothetical protein SGJ10_06135 [Bacteroidota bacterium]|nr:hypothetical protein [Bacteroidota bacterium]